MKSLKTTTPLSVLVIVMLTITGSGFANEPGAEQSHTLLNSVRRGLESSPRLAGEVHALEAIFEDSNVSFGAMLPTVDLRGSAGREHSKFNDADARTYNTNSYGIEARQNLFNGFASQARYFGAHSEAMAQYYRVLDLANQISKEAALAHIKVSKFQRMLELAENHVKSHQDLMGRIQSKVEQGVSRSADLEQARARYTLALSNLATEKANTFSAMAEYQSLTDRVWPPQDKGNHQIETNFEIENRERITHALNNHYLLRSANARLQGAKYGVTASKEGFFPRVDLRAKSDRFSNYLSTFDERTISSVDLLASMNLYRGGADKAAEAAAIKRKHQAFDRKLIVCKSIRQSAQTGLYDVINIQKKQSYFKQQLDSIEKARAAYEQQYQIGRRNLIDLLNAENEMYQAQRNLIAVEAELSESKINLLAATGQLIDLFDVENLIQANAPARRQIALYQSQMIQQQEDLACPDELISLDNFNLPAIGFEPGLKGVKMEVPERPAEPIQLAQAGPSKNVVNPPDQYVKFSDPAKVSQKLIEKTRAWANAWAARDVNQYIGFYAPAFKPEEGNYEAWVVQRRLRVGSAQDLDIKLSEIQVVPSFEDPDVFETNFIQHYKAKNYRERSRKVLTWKQMPGGQWQIIREQNLPENTVLKPKTESVNVAEAKMVPDLSLPK